MDNLPVEIQLKIISYLDHEDIWSLSSVNKHCHSLIATNYFYYLLHLKMDNLRIIMKNKIKNNQSLLQPPSSLNESLGVDYDVPAFARQPESITRIRQMRKRYQFLLIHSSLHTDWDSIIRKYEFGHLLKSLTIRNKLNKFMRSRPLLTDPLIQRIVNYPTGGVRELHIRDLLEESLSKVFLRFKRFFDKKKAESFTSSSFCCGTDVEPESESMDFTRFFRIINFYQSLIDLETSQNLTGNSTGSTAQKDLKINKSDPTSYSEIIKRIQYFENLVLDQSDTPTSKQSSNNSKRNTKRILTTKIIGSRVIYCKV